MTTEKIVQRASDGTWWEPSHQDGYGLGDALADAISGKRCWYFRRVRLVPRGVVFRRWERTGEICEPVEGREFKVIDGREARKLASEALNEGAKP